MTFTGLSKTNALILGFSLFLGLIGLGYLLNTATIQYKQFERTVTVKGLSEQEHQADVVIWPIQFTLTNNDLAALYQDLERNRNLVIEFLIKNGIKRDDITLNSPAITDKMAQQYGSYDRAEFRYTGLQTVTVYSADIEKVRAVMGQVAELGKQGLVLTGDNYMAQTQYLFTRLNDIKPQMIEEATRQAREVAEKFAQDSDSKLGKIKQASQGQFSIQDRDTNNPHIKNVRVVSTIEYYLSD